MRIVPFFVTGLSIRVYLETQRWRQTRSSGGVEVSIARTVTQIAISCGGSICHFTCIAAPFQVYYIVGVTIIKSPDDLSMVEMGKPVYV